MPAGGGRRPRLGLLVRVPDIGFTEVMQHAKKKNRELIAIHAWQVARASLGGHVADPHRHLPLLTRARARCPTMKFGAKSETLNAGARYFIHPTYRIPYRDLVLTSYICYPRFPDQIWRIRENVQCINVPRRHRRATSPAPVSSTFRRFCSQGPGARGP